MSPDLADLSERVAALEARFEELAATVRDQADRQERHQETVLKELADIRQFLQTARAVGRTTIWLGGGILALASGLPPLIQWLHDHITLKP